MSQAETQVRLYDLDRVIHDPSTQVTSPEEIVVGARFTPRCELDINSYPNPYIDSNTEEVFEVLEAPKLIDGKMGFRVWNNYTFKDVNRSGRYEMTVYLADHGVISDERGMWNQVNWLEKVEAQNTSHS